MEHELNRWNDDVTFRKNEMLNRITYNIFFTCGSLGWSNIICILVNDFGIYGYIGAAGWIAAYIFALNRCKKDFGISDVSIAISVYFFVDCLLGNIFDLFDYHLWLPVTDMIEWGIIAAIVFVFAVVKYCREKILFFEKSFFKLKEKHIKLFWEIWGIGTAVIFAQFIVCVDLIMHFTTSNTLSVIVVILSAVALYVISLKHKKKLDEKRLPYIWFTVFFYWTYSYFFNYHVINNGDSIFQYVSIMFDIW